MSPLFVFASLALACGVSVDMKVLGFDAKGTRAAVRVETTGDVNEIRIDLLELKTGKVVETFGIVDGDATSKSERGQRWKEVEAKLKAAKFTSTTGATAMQKSGVTLPNGLTLRLKNETDEESGFSGNQLEAQKGTASKVLLSRTGPVSDAPVISGVYLSPDQKFAVAVEGGCVDGKAAVFSTDAVAKSL